MKPKILFISEKWPRNNPAYGMSCLYPTVFTTLTETGLAEFSAIHPDEWLITQGERIDGMLLTIVGTYEDRPDIIFYSWLSSQGPEPELIGICNPRMVTWARIKTMAPNIKLCGIWGDSAWHMSQQIMRSLNSVFDLHLTLDYVFSPEPHNYLSLWGYPLSTSIFHGDPTGQRFIDVSFVGSLGERPDRITAIQELRNRGIDVKHFGGQTEDRLTVENYASVLQQSKITLNFSTITSKGRTKEAIACGAFLLEPETSPTNIWMTPGEDYITYKMNGDTPDFDDLATKINYYLQHEDERIKVAKQGYTTMARKHSPMVWWKTVLGRLGFKND